MELRLACLGSGAPCSTFLYNVGHKNQKQRMFKPEFDKVGKEDFMDLVGLESRLLDPQAMPYSTALQCDIDQAPL